MVKRVVVTDHAIVRYLERGWGVDIEGLRARLAALAVTGVVHGADAVLIAGLRLKLEGGVVVTVTGIGAEDTRRARRMRRRVGDG